MMNRSAKVIIIVLAVVAAFYLLFNYYIPSKIGAASPAVSYRRLVSDVSNKPKKAKTSEVKRDSIAPRLGVSAPKTITYETFDGRNVSNPNSKTKNTFAVPKEIETEVNFWKNIYTKYDQTKVVIHDKKYLDIVYSVVDLADLYNNPRLTPDEVIRRKKDRVSAEMGRIAAILKTLDKKDPATLTEEEKKVYHLFDNVFEDKKFAKATTDERFRSQTGIKDKFIIGIKNSGKYLGEMEKIFESYKIPLEISRLAFVESMFNLAAFSKVGASGIWQFMPSSARLFNLKINSVVDERNDPITATYAAAMHLKRDYDSLGAWPLAVNAYNTGPGRMHSAVRRMGTTDIAKIIKNFDYPGYGFASRNFYPAFLAVLDSFENREKYFGKIDMDAPISFDLLETPFFTSLPELAKYTGVPLEKIALLNPHLQDEVMGGRVPVPVGFNLRVPKGLGEDFLVAMNEMDSLTKYAKWHMVQPGENLKTIAAKYGTDIQKLKNENNISGINVKAGQIIRLPQGIDLAKEESVKGKENN